MRSIAIVVVLALGTALALWAATPAEDPKAGGVKPPDAKKTVAKTATAKATQSKGTTSGTTPASKAATGKKTTSAKQTSAKQKSAKQASQQAAARYRRSAQKEPAPERYKEIQQSLADKGYFAGPVNGTWGTDSVEALKRFQRDQNIGDDGKLGSMSLIALGLGPKREASGSSRDGKPENPAASPPPAEVPQPAR